MVKNNLIVLFDKFRHHFLEGHLMATLVDHMVNKELLEYISLVS